MYYNWRKNRHFNKQKHSDSPQNTLQIFETRAHNLSIILQSGQFRCLEDNPIAARLCNFGLLNLKDRFIPNL